MNDRTVDDLYLIVLVYVRQFCTHEKHDLKKVRDVVVPS